MDTKNDSTKPSPPATDRGRDVAEVSVAAPAPAAAAKRSHAEWAAKHGMTPQILDQPKVTNVGAKLIPGRLNPKWQEYAEARAHHSWLVNTEMTEAEFLSALDAPKAHVFR